MNLSLDTDSLRFYRPAASFDRPTSAWFTQPRTMLTLVVNEPPARAAIDPYSKLTDRNPKDNPADVE
jgi:hypothetical protein